MLPPIILSVLVGFVCALGAYRSWQMGNVKGQKKAQAGVVICAVFAALFLLVAVTSNSSRVWWGSGCSMMSYRNGMCPPIPEIHRPQNLK